MADSTSGSGRASSPQNWDKERKAAARKRAENSALLMAGKSTKHRILLPETEPEPEPAPDGAAALLISQLFDAIDKDGSVSFFRLFGRVTARVSMTLLSSRVDWSLMLG